MASRPAVICALLLSAAACSDPAPPRIAVVRVVPQADPTCGAPADGRTLVLEALGDFPAAEVVETSQPIDGSGVFAIDSLALDTRVLEVQVLGAGGAVRTVGKTAPALFEELDDGDTLSVFMAPPRGLCATGPPDRARLRPLLARVGDHVLVAGGLGQDLEPVREIERYDPDLGAFRELELDHYGTGSHGLLGASLTSVRLYADPEPAAARVIDMVAPPTHALLAGGGSPAYQVYDGATGALSPPYFLEPGRAFHAAVALDRGQVFLAGGCSPLTPEHRCEPSSALLDSSIVDLEAQEVRPGPRLLRPRIRGHALREAADSVLLIGGLDDSGAPITEIERVHPSGALGQVFPGAGGAAALLASGSALVGTGSPDAPGDALLAVVPARGDATSALMGLPWPVAGATMTPLEDGAVLIAGAGSSAQGGLGLYLPESGDTMAVDTGATQGRPGAEHSAVALADGTVLLVGGRPANDPAGPAQARAFIVRPELLGPFAGDVFLSFGAPELSRNLIPRDATRHERVPARAPAPAHQIMRAGPGGSALPAEWSVVAGPLLSRGRVDARVRSLGGGVAVMLGFRDAGAYMAVILAEGQPITVYRVTSNLAVRLSECQGRVVASDDLAPDEPDAAVPIALEFTRDALHLAIADQSVMACERLSEPVPVGRVGIGVVGALDAGLRVDLLAVSRH